MPSRNTQLASATVFFLIITHNNGQPNISELFIIYFASAAIAVDSSHMTVSSSASWSRFNHRKVIGRDLVCAWALTCPETVHQRLCMTREMETWLLDSRVGNNSNSVVDHRSRQPVLSPLRNFTTV